MVISCWLPRLQKAITDHCLLTTEPLRVGLLRKVIYSKMSSLVSVLSSEKGKILAGRRSIAKLRAVTQSVLGEIGRIRIRYQGQERVIKRFSRTFVMRCTNLQMFFQLSVSTLYSMNAAVRPGQARICAGSPDRITSKENCDIIHIKRPPKCHSKRTRGRKPAFLRVRKWKERQLDPRGQQLTFPRCD